MSPLKRLGGQIAAHGASRGCLDKFKSAPRGAKNRGLHRPTIERFFAGGTRQSRRKTSCCPRKRIVGGLADENQRKVFRDRWLARKDGILTQVNELWLKPAPKDAKREVGQRVNKLKAEVEAKVEAALAKRRLKKLHPRSTFPFPAFAAPSAPSTRSSARRTRSSRCFAISVIRWPKGR